jgi:DNA-binding transcriptional LysR family regulator
LAHAPADPRLLQGAKWLLPMPGHGLHQIVDRYIEDHDLAPRQPVIETDASISLLTSLLRNSDLITMLTEQMLQTYASRDLAALPYKQRYSKAGSVSSTPRKQPCRLPFRDFARRCMKHSLPLE